MRTDVERILASNPSAGGNLTAANAADLKYCTRVRYMDIGHNEILGDISFVQYMPELEVLIAAMDGLSDISPISACTKLEYLEIPQNFDFNKVSGLTIECRQKLFRYNPRTIAQASRISGVSPSDISVLLVYFGR